MRATRKATTEELIERIELAFGPYVASDENPCGCCAYYDEGEEKPWRIADDHAHERFSTFHEAEAAAEEWRRAFDAE